MPVPAALALPRSPATTVLMSTTAGSTLLAIACASMGPLLWLPEPIWGARWIGLVAEIEEPWRTSLPSANPTARPAPPTSSASAATPASRAAQPRPGRRAGAGGTGGWPQAGCHSPCQPASGGGGELGGGGGQYPPG